MCLTNPNKRVNIGSNECSHDECRDIRTETATTGVRSQHGHRSEVSTFRLHYTTPLQTTTCIPIPRAIQSNILQPHPSSVGHVRKSREGQATQPPFLHIHYIISPPCEGQALMERKRADRRFVWSEGTSCSVLTHQYTGRPGT